MLTRRSLSLLGRRVSCRGVSIRLTSSESEAAKDTSNAVKTLKEYPFYEGYYSKKLKMLRRVSISSSFFSVVGLPLVISLSTGDMSTAAKISIASTAVVASLGSTAILHAITHPYITELKYVDDSEDSTQDLKFRATRLNLLGNPRVTDFSASEMEEVRVTNHPYANFQVKGNYYYVRHESVQNEILRKKLEERCNKRVTAPEA